MPIRRLRTTSNMKNLKVLGVCGGQGALLYPFRYHLVANIEPRGVFHTPNEEQWKLNFGEIPFERELIYDKIGDLDVIIGSPDCGSCSIMRLSKSKKLGNPKKNSSINLFIRAVNQLHPKVFLLENLPRLASVMDFEKAFPNYEIITHQESVAELGNSQVSRKRLIVIGVNKFSKIKLKYFKKLFQVRTPKLTRELISAPLREEMPDMNKKLAMYDYRKLPKKDSLTVKEIHDLWVKDFQDEYKWPIKTAKMHTLPGVYRLRADKYPLTLRPSDRQFRPDGWPLTITDFKTIMGFPKGFKIYLDKEKLNYWLNKARYSLAKGATYETGMWFKKCIYKAIQKISEKDF